MKKRSVYDKKEMLVFIMLLILIILILAVALYDFIPTNINIPEIISYSSDSATTSIKQEIAYINNGDSSADGASSDSELITALKSYSIDSSDLKVYGQKNLYKSGKSNPFDDIEDEPNESSNNETNSSNTNNTANTNNSNKVNSNNSSISNSSKESKNTGTFFEQPNSK